MLQLAMGYPLVVATLRAVGSFSDAAFRQQLPAFFPLLTSLIGCEHAPPEVQRALSDLFARRIGPLLSQPSETASLGAALCGR